MVSLSAPSSALPSGSAAPLRSFGRFRLLRLVGKSERTMSWLVDDAREQRELLLVLPRRQVHDTAAAEQWAQTQRQVARLKHPNLAPLLEIGVHESWPYAAYAGSGIATLADRIGNVGLAGAEAVPLASMALRGLAYAHDAGIAHHDLQAHHLLVDDAGNLCVAGLEVALPALDAQGAAPVPEAPSLRAQRDAAERDVLALGLVLHHALAASPALDEKDIGRIIDRLPPQGHELVRLPWSTRQVIPEVLRAIVNRATDRQAAQRYRNARTFERALEGWLRSDEQLGGGPLAMLMDRLASHGLLPAAPGAAGRSSRLALMDRQRTNEMAGLVLEDLGLTFELLRNVNSAQLQGGSVAGSGAVITVRRAIAMLGLDAVRRSATALRPWPGALPEVHIGELERLIARVKHAGRIAVVLCPAGYDAEVVYILTVLQNLGRLVVQYHSAEEAAQIRRLMQPLPPEKPGDSVQPGMSEEAAAFSVLGVDIEAIGIAVARRWGLDESALPALRRWPAQAPIRGGEGDAELLRSAASCGNEAVDILRLPAAQQMQAFVRLAARYARVLHAGPKDLQAAVQDTARSSISTMLAEANGNAFFSSGFAALDGESVGAG